MRIPEGLSACCSRCGERRPSEDLSEGLTVDDTGMAEAAGLGINPLLCSSCWESLPDLLADPGRCGLDLARHRQRWPESIICHLPKGHEGEHRTRSIGGVSIVWGDR